MNEWSLSRPNPLQLSYENIFLFCIASLLPVNKDQAKTLQIYYIGYYWKNEKNKKKTVNFYFYILTFCDKQSDQTVLSFLIKIHDTKIVKGEKNAFAFGNEVQLQKKNTFYLYKQS